MGHACIVDGHMATLAPAKAMLMAMVMVSHILEDLSAHSRVTCVLHIVPNMSLACSCCRPWQREF